MPQVYDENGRPVFNPNGTPAIQSNDGYAAPPRPPLAGTAPSRRGGGIGSDMNLDPRKARMDPNGLLVGGVAAAAFAYSFLTSPTVIPGVSSYGAIDSSDDWRVRISLPVQSSNFYMASQPQGNNFLQPIVDSGLNGVVFPYTPSISVSHNARYTDQALTHSNYKNYFYEGSDVSAITITGEFSVQNEQEGEYLLACVWFLRACTKMFWGADPQAGTPPTIVYLDGYGQGYFPHVSCVVTNFTHTLPPDVDYMPLKSDLFGTRVPTMSQISVTLQPVVSRARVASDFDLNNYSWGGTIGDRYTGGFL